MTETDVYDALIKAKEAYDDIPKASFKREIEGNIETISCPCCGSIFAQIDWSLVTGFRFDEPIICCGKLLR